MDATLTILQQAGAAIGIETSRSATGYIFGVTPRGSIPAPGKTVGLVNFDGKAGFTLAQGQ